MANIIKSISIPQDICNTFIRQHPAINFSRWVTQQMQATIKEKEETPVGIDWKQFAKSTGMTIDELKEIQRVSKADPDQVGE